MNEEGDALGDRCLRYGQVDIHSRAFRPVFPTRALILGRINHIISRDGDLMYLALES